MRTAIIGSRNLCLPLKKFIKIDDIDEIITGGARGIDYCAQLFAKNSNIPCRVIEPNYSLYGNKAPIIRNKEIANSCDHLIAIWDGNSKGTKNTIDFAIHLNKIVTVFLIKNNITKKYVLNYSNQLRFF